MIEIRHTTKDSTALRKAYDVLYGQSTTEHSGNYYRWILNELRPRSGSSLLDVCCGTARLAEEARKLQVQATGSDFSVVALSNSSAPVAVADAEHLPYPNNTFDYVVNLGSLEHLVHIEQGIAEMVRVLRPGGVCCVLVPNTFGLFWTIRHAYHTGDIADDGQPLQRYGTRQQWQRLLEVKGFYVERVIGYEVPPPETVRQWLGTLRRFRYHFLPAALRPYIPVNLASMLVYFCRKSA
jgi:SAM-dependent methyltransferase